MKTNVIFFINNVINKRPKIESTASFVSGSHSPIPHSLLKLIYKQEKPPQITFVICQSGSAILGLACNNDHHIHKFSMLNDKHLLTNSYQ